MLAGVVLALFSVASPQLTSAQVAAHTVLFGLVGDVAYDPAGGAGGTTRDINNPNSLVVNPGDRVDFVNRSGGQHQPAVFGPNLRNKGTAIATNLEDLTISHTAPPAWGNFVVPPDGAVPSADDAATDIDERRVRDGLIGLGPTPVGVSTADRQAGAIDYSYTFTTPGSYMIICNFRPHVLAFGQATFVLVRGTPPTTAAPAAAAAPAVQTTGGTVPAAQTSPATTQAVPAAPKTGQAGLLSDQSTGAAWALLALTTVLVVGGRTMGAKKSAR
jgi:plastocyanin